MALSGQLYAPAALLPRKQSRYSLCRRVGGPKSRSGRFGENNLLLLLSPPPPPLIIIIIIITIMQLEAAHAVEITKLVEYVDLKEDPLIQVVRTHQHNTDSAVLEAARCLKTEVQRKTRKMKDSIAEKTKERWHGKSMHGQLPRNSD
jgi:hypothetical protein